MNENTSPVTIADIEKIAAEKIPGFAFDYYSSGADDEITLRENSNAFDRILLNYRVLVDVSSRDLSVTILGEKISMPVIIAPTAFHRLAHPDGELAVARAASAEQTIMTLSTLSNSGLEEVARETKWPLWFQLYVFKDREVTRELVAKAETAGCKALVLTVDAPLLGRRIRDVRNRFNLPEGIVVKNLEPFMKEMLPRDQESGIAGYFARNLDPSLSWKDVEWLKSISRLPVIVKGIICREDAMLAVENGVDGIVVSNHGGRQLDTCSATVDALPGIAEAVSKKILILVDGGIRRGTDVLKAVALGADAVLIGRPVIYGLGYDGEKGVRKVFEILRTELDLAMALCGCRSIGEIKRSLIVK